MKALTGRRQPLSERDIEVLRQLAAATDYGIAANWREGFVRPMDVGGANGSHHGATLAKLEKRGLAERRGYRGVRRMNLYRITQAGRHLLEK